MAGEHSLAEDLRHHYFYANRDNKNVPTILTDVSFIVEEGSAQLYAHRFILDLRAPHLLESIKEDKTFNEEDGTFFVPDIKGEALHELLSFLYSGSVSSKKALKDFGLLAAAIKVKYVFTFFKTNLLFPSNSSKWTAFESCANRRWLNR